MPDQAKEARVNLAIQAIQLSRKLSCRAAAKLYNVPETTLRDRMNGAAPIAERWLVN
jgi:helix-turn-helix, Psq domain